MTTQLLSVRLGDLHELFLLMCQQLDIEPQNALKDLVTHAAHASTQAHPELSTLTQQKSPRIRFSVAGDLHEQFINLCKYQDKPSGSVIRHLAQQAILAKFANTTQNKSPQQATNQEKALARVHVGIVDSKRERIELRLTHSEFTALDALAKQRSCTSQRLIAQILRAFLLKSCTFSQEEITSLGAVNLSLMRCGNNLNQIAKHFNEARTKEAAIESTELLSTQSALTDCVREINSYVKDCAQLLQQSRHRWLIELKA